MDPRLRLDEIARGYQDAIVLLTANQLGIFASLLAEPKQAAEVARGLDLDVRAVECVLLALAAIGVLDRAQGDRFAVNAAFAPLLDAHDDRGLTSILSHHFHLLSRWIELPAVLRSGEPVGVRERTPSALRAFICGMRDISRRSSREVADALPELSGCRRLLDLGGGPGTSSLVFCDRWPELTAVVFDLPDVVPIAQEEIRAAGLASRITTRAGDYLADPLKDADESPFDALYLSNVIHSLDAVQVRALLAKATAALAPGGLLVVKDFFLNDARTAPAQAARFSVNMLVSTRGGKSYTWTEVAAMLAELGLAAPTRRPVAVASGLLVARRA